MAKHTNHLINETSPYLLQHAHNPVNWYPWSEDALQLAKKENKPILVSIGYSACHWCHVMERESFEDEATAELMNEKFINIKIDREERPDLDHIYMDAVQAMSGSGGWPLNVFLTPDRKPFYGGTYYPPQPAFNRPSWKDVLMGVSKAYYERRHEVDAQAENLTEHLKRSNTFGMNGSPTADLYSETKLGEAVRNIMGTADREWGGFGRAPKFPQTFTITFLLRYAHSSKSDLANSAKQQALLTIDKMIDGGIYDQIGGGFSRYSTDTEWLAPHFEKMLYDNALLISTISEAYQLTGNERYREVIDETIAFLEREMLHSEGGFYSALDADSEGVEGKFYVWSKKEVDEILGTDADLFNKFFDITEKGNWEHSNIARRKLSVAAFAKQNDLTEEQLNEIISRGKQKLLRTREKRIRPGTDDKIILGWNALMIVALCKAFAATTDEHYRSLAVRNMDFLLKRFAAENGSFYHTWKDAAKYPAFLDDYAYLIQAMIALQEITGNLEYLNQARDYTQYVMENFSEEGTGFFFYTSSQQTDVILRKKEVFDGAQPSGNAVMIDNLYRMALYFDVPEWKRRAMETAQHLGEAIIRYPTSFGVWATFVQEITRGTNELVLVGPEAGVVLKELLRAYIPHKVVMYTEKESSDFPLLKDKKKGVPAFIYLCRDFVCKKPVLRVNELLDMISAK